MKTEIMEVCNQEMKKKEGKNKGFSLVELIVVIAIMAILAIVIAPQVMKYIGQSRKSVDATNISAYKTAVNTALANEDVYAEVAEGSGSIKIVVNGSAKANFSYTNTNKDSKLMVELEEILGGSYPLPKETDMNAFEINIAVDATKDAIGAVTVKAMKQIATP
ncbi:prepilin-type N-terminal cleavage/methylation domain-containing protein [Anaerosporobacter mobilis DSM 15930]|uniref:Prepilin-type N-terminal cleavage/methylation domain-containing protein n=1 Tax=Anaerosporobacter mobilis DSM 15930 TaxID=1120996 RepID=A0A1M7H4I1_9FIRM|nr:prepilin-type N-terminal cleavage/methylation domain-containing protein [Anaerosporobacter mobilis]SHM23256.1 prepilin-type N-terminal cleavage/methylation domain-containing protein [Anaerosporobacter mobilis DSM 15930]